MVDERRKHRRVAQPIECVWRGASGFARSRIADISCGGCFVSALAMPVAGEETQIELIHGSRSLSLVGRVVNVDPGIGFALTFDGNPAETLVELADFIRVLESTA